jgi:Transglycosylase SLT domain
MLLLVICVAHGQRSNEGGGSGGDSSSETRIKFSDGSSAKVDEAWESEQGIWYRVGGISHLVERARVKKIERGIRPAPAQVAKVVETDSTETEQNEGPLWIYLVGGAKVEADSATESSAGVWYKRGSFTIFIDRSRVDHIEREVENVAGLDSSTKRARGWTTGNSRIDSLIKQNGARYSVDPYLIFCVMEQESHFNSRALSPKGARGLMQLMPGTAARFGVRRASDPAQNIAGGTRYLKELMGRFNGRIDLVLAGYNAGEGAVMKFGHRVPPYRETRNYVKRISYRYRQAKPAKAVVAQVPVAGS